MNNKQQTAMKLYTEEQLLNTADAIRDYLKNYPEKFHESMKHYDNNHADYYFELGAKWMRDKIQGYDKQ